MSRHIPHLAHNRGIRKQQGRGVGIGNRTEIQFNDGLRAGGKCIGRRQTQYQAQLPGCYIGRVGKQHSAGSPGTQAGAGKTGDGWVKGQAELQSALVALSGQLHHDRAGRCARRQRGEADRSGRTVQGRKSAVG